MDQRWPANGDAWQGPDGACEPLDAASESALHQQWLAGLGASGPGAPPWLDQPPHPEARRFLPEHFAIGALWAASVALAVWRLAGH